MPQQSLGTSVYSFVNKAVTEVIDSQITAKASDMMVSVVETGFKIINSILTSVKDATTPNQP